MKKSIVALAVLGSFAGVAAAQSSVTLFGVVDAAMRYTDANGKSVYSLASGGNTTSRFGVRGVEDLGGDLKAGFWLEGAVNTDTGAADSAFWARRATVSLISASMGEVRLGRFKTITKITVEDFDPVSATGLGSVYNLYSTLGATGLNTSRTDNQVSYSAPANLGGFYGTLEASAGEGTNELNKSVGGRVGYKAGAFNVAAAYTEFGTNTKFKFMSLGGSYDFGMAKVSGLYSTNEFGEHSQDLYTIAVTAPIGAGSVWASYTDASYSKSNAKTVAVAGDSSQLAAGYVHNLSKRTALYTTVSYIDNKAGASFGVNGTGASANPAVVKDGRSGGVDVGVRHSF
ncbi:porin [Paucibacter sp. TC2R-5]|uniref:porin n=1 Tax=Paucibacter sp. TC2R-5 TaxID=2893555 RepID=UPI0021E4A632|nr:porin [Paucibacter sp. TC2R-5]MCV2359472.1 porin [Paucibacter sp. TC2R-5]